jgi:hypothetical protein
MKKSQLTMNGKTFKECWTIQELNINDNDNIVVNFINDVIVNVICNDKKIWSVINTI